MPDVFHGLDEPVQAGNAGKDSTKSFQSDRRGAAEEQGKLARIGVKTRRSAEAATVRLREGARRDLPELVLCVRDYLLMRDRPGSAPAPRSRWRDGWPILFAACIGLGAGRPSPHPSRFVWSNVATEGMGYVTGLVIHPDTRRAPNLIYVRTDIGGAYRFDAARQRWRPLLDMFGPTQGERYRVESLALDPTNPDIVYIATDGGVLRSADQGRHWSDTGLHGVYTAGNDLFRGSSGERLAVDPSAPETLYYGTRRDGLWRKQGAQDWARVPGLPVTTCSPQGGSCVDAGMTFVVFGAGRRGPAPIYVGVYGNGLWTSADSGRTWRQLGGGRNPLRAAAAGDGSLYVTFGGSEVAYAGPGAVRRCADGQCTDVTPGGHAVSYSGVSTGRAPGVVMVTTNQGQIYRSTDRGRSWKPVPIHYVHRPGYYWTADWYRWGSAALVIDPNDAAGRRVWRTDGFGVSRTDDVKAENPEWRTVMAGLEELVVASLRAPPKLDGPRLISAAADAEGLVYERLDTPPSRKLNPGRKTVTMGTSVDYSNRAPENLAFVG